MSSEKSDLVLEYHSHGWMPIPLPKGSKNPNRRGWQNERWSREDLPNCFNNGQNVGLLLGEPSCGLIDVDLDSTEAIVLADAILPATGMISGRASSPCSHRWYICDPLIGTAKFLDPLLSNTDERAMIVELRSTGGQTVVPPSIHPTGENYIWHGELTPSTVSGDDLLKGVRELAACALIARHWKRGQRHDTSLALAGTLLRAKWPRIRVERFIRLAATAANDEEVDDRVRSVETTEQKIISGQKVKASYSLVDLIGVKVVATLQKWLALTVAANQQAAGSKAADPIRLICLADVKSEQVSFLWSPYIPKGKLTLIEGDPGVGKSWLTCALATAVASGTGPPGWTKANPANVLMLSVEDGLSDTIRPRLDSMGADVNHIFAIEGAIVFNDAGLRRLEDEILKVHPAIVIVDPLVAYIGAKVDLHKANETRAVTARLAMLAEKHGCAIVAIRHLTKGGADRAIYRGIGSIDITAACRSALLVGCDPDDQTKRAIVHIKSNLAEKGDAVGYEIRGGIFSWTGASTLTAGQILASSDGEGGHTQRQNAEEFLKHALADGVRPSKEIQKEAREAGISSATLYRAKDALNIKARKEGQPGDPDQRWVWVLPHGEDHHEDYQIEVDDNLRTNESDKGIKSQHLTEDYQTPMHDDLRIENDNLRGVENLISCNACGSQGISFTHCNRCGEFLR
jgi:hypothetical protein